MKYDYPLSLTSIHNGNFENQLKQFCIDNKFLYTGVQWNVFADGSHVLWNSIEWLKNRKYHTGEFIRYPDGNIKKDRKVLLSRVRVFGPNIPLNDAKEFLSLEILKELFVNYYIDKPESVAMNSNENGETEVCGSYANVNST